jgi:hypothetical protein
MRRNGNADCTVRLILLQKHKGCTGEPALAHVVVRSLLLNRRSLCGWSTLRKPKGLGFAVKGQKAKRAVERFIFVVRD